MLLVFLVVLIICVMSSRYSVALGCKFFTVGSCWVNTFVSVGLVGLNGFSSAILAKSTFGALNIFALLPYSMLRALGCVESGVNICPMSFSAGIRNSGLVSGIALIPALIGTASLALVRTSASPPCASASPNTLPAGLFFDTPLAIPVTAASATASIGMLTPKVEPARMSPPLTAALSTGFSLMVLPKFSRFNAAVTGMSRICSAAALGLPYVPP